MLTQGSIDQNSFPKLSNYVNNGGILLPNLVKGESTLEAESLNRMLMNISGNNSGYSNIMKANISYYSPNKIVIEGMGKKGFLVLSEQFSMYPGWGASDGTSVKKIYRADGVISAVYINGNERQIIFTYKEPSFLKGALISSATLLFIIVYFTYFLIRRYKHNKKESIAAK